MKRLSMIILMLAFGLQYVVAQDQPETKVVDPIQWTETIHDFGQIILKKPAKATFTFTNSSEAPVVITNVRSSCGCTVANYTKEPVRPGENGEVSATYNAARVGRFTKTVTVTVDAVKTPIILKIKGEVVEKPAEETPSEE